MTLLGVQLGLLLFGCGMLAFAAPFLYLLVYALRGGKSTELIRVGDRDLHPWKFWLTSIATSFLLFEIIYGGIGMIREALHE